MEHTFALENMDALEALCALEEIKQLKARYFRFLDEKRWDDLRTVFTDDFKGLYQGPHPDVHYKNGDEIVTQMRELLNEATTVHHGHTPEIQLLSKSEAQGVWAMMDFVQFGEQCFRGYGSYRDKYRKEKQQWRICETNLIRFHIQPLQSQNA